jgi:hypothetical protein
MGKHSKLICCAGLLLVLWACTAAAAPADGEPAGQPAQGGSAKRDARSKPVPFLGGFLTETRILYPLRVDHWESQREHRYDDAEYGASVRYQDSADDERWLDVYFYPIGLVPPASARSEMEGVMRAIAGSAGQPDSYQRVALGDTHAFKIRLDPADADSAITAYSGALDFTSKEGHYSSAIVVLVKDLYYIKARMSLPAKRMPPQAVRDQLEAFMATLVQQSTLISTGACWSYSNQKSTSDASVAGCTSPEQMTPSVPAELRELRFEYPPPSDRNDGSTPRLRSARRGVG